MKSLRTIAAAVALGLAASGHVAAQAPKDQEQLKPYLQVKPVAGDEDMVRAFFTPSCPYSKLYFQFFKNLAATLPEGKRFAFTPLVNKGDGVPFAVAYLAVQRFYPAYTANFVEASLVGVQERHINIKTWAGIYEVGQAAHIPVSLPRLVQQNQAVLQADLNRTLALQKRLEITNTPAVAVAGTYIVTPEFTAGDASMFSQLVNGVISMAR